MLRWIDSILSWLFWYFLRRTVCQHVCLYREAGSDMRYVHVHFLTDDDRYDITSNPRNYTALGHDDHTNPNDPHHNTVSRNGRTTFMTPGQVPLPITDIPVFSELLPKPNEGIAPLHLQAKLAFTVYAIPADEEDACPDDFLPLRCPCGSFCITFDHATWERWYRQQPDDEEGEDEPGSSEGSGD